MEIQVRMVEALDVLRGLKLAREDGVAELVVETDAQLVIHVLQSPPTQLTYFGILIDDIVSFSESFNSISFLWSRRTGNMLAHKLNLFGFDCERPLFSTVVLDTLVDYVLADLTPTVDL